MMAAFIKTSKGFINIEQVERVTTLDGKGSICIELTASEMGHWFEGAEAARIVRYFNLISLLDTTIEDEAPVSPPEAPEFPHGEFDNGNHWQGSEEPDAGSYGEYQHIKAQQRS